MKKILHSSSLAWAITRFRVALVLLLLFSFPGARGAAQSPTQPLTTIITEDAMLTASDAYRQDYFGISVSLLGDRALVGGQNTGSAYIFGFDGTTWTQQAILIGSDTLGGLDKFGYSVSLSGNRALVGARSDDLDTRIAAGSAYVFVFDGTTWTQEAKLTASDGQAVDYFGTSVSLSGDRALIGSDPSGAPGKAYVFVFDGTNWNQEAKLTPSDGTVDDNFGFSVSLSAKRALIGAPSSRYPILGPGRSLPNDSESAYVFVFDGTTWSQEAKLTPSDGMMFDNFGASVSLSGKRALIGSPGAGDSGAAYVFASNGITWSQEAKLLASDGITNDKFGTSVSLSGKRALVAADEYLSGGAGAAYLFVFDGATWNEELKLIASQGAPGDLFGHAVSLSRKRALVGVPQDNVNGGRDPGSAYIFTLSPQP